MVGSSSTLYEVDRWRWPATLMVGTGFLVLLSLHVLLGWPNSLWLGPSSVGSDMRGTVLEAHAIATGHLHSLYNVGSYDNLPLWPLVLAPVMTLADALGFRSSPSELLSAGYLVPASLLVGIMLAHAGRTLAWQLGARRHLWIMQIVLLYCVLLPCLVYGHMEDALALSLLLYSLSLLRSGRTDAAALLMGLSIASKEWGLLLAPVLVLAVGQRWRRFVALTFAPPVALGLTALALDPGPAFQQLLARTAYSPDSPVVRYGFSALFGERGSQLTRPVELALVLLLAKQLRGGRRQLLPFAVVGALLLRPLAEPVVFPYYWVPSVALLIVLLAARTRSAASPWLLVPAALTLWSQRWDIPGTLWWPGELLLFALSLLVVVPAMRGLLGDCGESSSAYSPGEVAHPLPSSYQIPSSYPIRLPRPDTILSRRRAESRPRQGLSSRSVGDVSPPMTGGAY